MKHEKAWMMGGMLLASLCGGALTSLFGSHVDAQGSQVVTTTQLNLVDAGGNLRGVLSAEDERGMTSLAFYDASGQVRGTFGVEASGAPVLRFENGAGVEHLVARVSNADTVFVVGDDQQRHGVFASVSGTPVLSLADGGQSRAQLQLGAEGEPSLVLFGRQGRRSVAVTVDRSDAPVVTLYEQGSPRATLGVVQQAAVINLSDGGQTRLVIGVADSGQPSISFLNENGDFVQTLP